VGDDPLATSADDSHTLAMPCTYTSLMAAALALPATTVAGRFRCRVSGEQSSASSLSHSCTGDTPGSNAAAPAAATRGVLLLLLLVLRGEGRAGRVWVWGRGVDCGVLLRRAGAGDASISRAGVVLAGEAAASWGWSTSATTGSPARKHTSCYALVSLLQSLTNTLAATAHGTYCPFPQGQVACCRGKASFRLQIKQHW
jgi:hypothetical protein